MTELAGYFERAISAAPADWHMFQPLWEADLAERGVAPGGGARVAA
jgi:lauroyl/myristoyl acyltransferase